MDTNSINTHTANYGKTIAGVIILIIGGLLLVDNFNLALVPDWLFSWPMWIIAYGLYMGGKYNFRKPIWIYTIVLGTAFLLTENMANADRFVWPVAVIGLGAWMITKQQSKLAANYPGADQKKV